MLTNPKRHIDLSQYENITKDYGPLTFDSGEEIKYKIRYNNPDDMDKRLSIVSTDNVILVRKPELQIESKDNDYIRFTIRAPLLKCSISPSLVIINKVTDKIEEILRFQIEVNK